MTDTYEGKEAWLRTVRNAKQAGVLDNPKALVHCEAKTLSERSAMVEQNREVSRVSFTVPDLPWQKGA